MAVSELKNPLQPCGLKGAAGLLPAVNIAATQVHLPRFQWYGKVPSLRSLLRRTPPPAPNGGGEIEIEGSASRAPPVADEPPVVEDGDEAEKHNDSDPSSIVRRKRDPDAEEHKESEEDQ